MNILAIGNSFSQDATRYLHQIAAADGEKVRVVNLYIGGCPLVTHYNNFIHDKRSYSYEYNGEATGIYVSISQALRSQKWDVITLQQVSHKSVRYETYHPYIDVLAAECRRAAPNARLLIHETWAYEDGGSMLHNLGYEKSTDMYNDLHSAYAKAADDIKADGIIPCGTVMIDLVGGGMKVHRDTFHASLGGGRLALGLTWYSYIMGRDISGNTFDALDEPAATEDIEKIKAAVGRAVKI